MHSKQGGRKSGKQQIKGLKEKEPALSESSAPDVELSPNKHEANAKPKGPKPWASQAKNKAPSPKAVSPRETPSFDVVAFRRALASILGDLASDRNVPAAVRRIRLQEVPVECQSQEFADIISRIVEERRGPIRRSALAFAAGLANAEQSAFDRNACLGGIGQFFREVYPELCHEIPRLPAIVTSELLPTLQNVFKSEELKSYLPSGFNLQIPPG